MKRNYAAQEFAAEDCAERRNEGEIKFQIDENAKVYKDGTAVIDGKVARYINPLYDAGFKILFGNDGVKEHLIGLLNALFPEKNIINLQYLNTEHFPRTTKERKSIFDVMCETDAGEQFIVEMQNAPLANMVDRMFYYSSFAIQEQAKTSREWKYKLKPVITVAILNFNAFDERFRKNLAHEGVYKFSYRSDDNGEKLTENLSSVFMEVPRGPDGYSDDMTYIGKWMYVFKHLERLMDKPEELQERVFKSIFRKAEIAAMSKDEFNFYISDMRTELDDICRIDYAEQKGEARGLEKGREEGREDRSVEIARNLKTEGLDFSLIMKTTGLSIEQINEL